MNRALASALVAVAAAALWLLWSFEHEHTRIRAPWTGLTYAAAVAGFIVAGIVGRGWHAVAAAAAAAAAAALAVDPLVWRTEPLEPGTTSSCDPGCISTEFAVVFYSVAGAILATIGVVLRRTWSLATRSRDTAPA